jgi:diacylglycerol kinase family enzyme
MMHALLGSPSPVTVVMNLPRMTRGKELRGRELIDRPCRELTLEAVGDELLAPVIDGEYYRNLRKVSFKLGPRVRIPKVVADTSTLQRRHA